MAIIRNSASALRKGRVGNTTYYVSGQRQIARVSQNSSNYGETARRTEAMQERRARWGNLVNFYKLSKGWMKYAYETKTSKQSDYNRFMQVNLNASSIYLTREEAALGACVVEPFAVTQGSLRAISVTRSGLNFTTDIELGDLVITDTTTVGSFSAQVIGLNNGVEAGYQLSFISYQQYSDANGIPQVVCTAYEVTLDTSSEAKLRDYLPEFCTTNQGTKLGTSNAISAGCFAYIWSDTRGGTTRVSSQSLVNNNLMMIADFSSSAQRTRAIESYGLDVDSFLMSGSTPQVPTPATQAIRYVSSSSTGPVEPGGYWSSSLADLAGQTLDIRMARYQPTSNVKAYAVIVGGTRFQLSNTTMLQDGTIQGVVMSTQLTTPVTGFVVELDGVTYTIEYNHPEPTNDD